MNKDKEVEVDLMEKVADLIILCRIKGNMNGRMMKKIRLSGKVVVLSKEVLVHIEEEVTHILEVFFMVIVSDVIKRDIDLLNVDLLKVDKVKKCCGTRRHKGFT